MSNQYGAIGEEHLVPVKGGDDCSRQSSTMTDLTDSSDISTELESLTGRHFGEKALERRVSQALGFSNNPFKHSTSKKNDQASDMRLAMLSNFSTSYNIVSISLALDMMQELYPCTPNDKSMCSSALIAGMIVGQLFGGAVGDILGRHFAMAFVMGLQVTGALMTALSQDGYFSIYMLLSFWRFVLGVGCGGVYPLSATITAESGSEKDGGKAVALTFSFQGVGYLMAPLLASGLATIFPSGTDAAWRCLLGFGIVPGLVLAMLRLRAQKKHETYSKSLVDKSDVERQSSQARASIREVPVSLIDAILVETDLVRKMLGTGGCWFVFDILFYGNILFQPVVLGAAFGKTETIAKTAKDSVIVAAIALPGYFFSVLAIGRQSPRHIQAQGFLLMSVLYAIIAVYFHELANYKLLMIILYSSTLLFSNYGPNSTTFVLPSMTFSRPCRATLNGVCAACGKAGALLGTIFFVTAASRFGQQAVMGTCACLSIVGMVLTLTCVPEHLQTDSPEDVARKSMLPMKVVVSEPCLIDYFETA